MIPWIVNYKKKTLQKLMVADLTYLQILYVNLNNSNGSTVTMQFSLIQMELYPV